MKVVAIIQARMGSTRLPGKVLKPLAGKAMINFMLDRVAKSSKVNEIILATGAGEENDLLAEVVRKAGYQVFRGSEDDVLERYALAAKEINADVIVRLTGDCPLVDHLLIDLLIETLIDGDYQYVTNVKPPTWPDGLDVSVFTMEILLAAYSEATKPSDREHVVPWMWRNSSLEGSDRFSAVNVSSSHDLSALRWTVDDENDYKLMQKLAVLFGKERFFYVTTEEIQKAFEENKELKYINFETKRDEGYLKSVLVENSLCESERLYLRKINLTDVDGAYFVWMNDASILKHTASRGKKYSKENLRSYIAEQNEREDVFFLAIVEKQRNVHIGNIKIGPIDYHNKCGDMGIIIGEKAEWGKGYGTEAISLFVDYVFSNTQVNKITAGFFEGNESSKKAFLKSGFTLTDASQKYLESDKTNVMVTWMEINRKPGD